MQYITSGNRIAVENFTVGYLYTITFTNGNYIHCACTGIGMDFVMFSRTAPEFTFALTMETAADVSSIDLYSEGGGTTNYNELANKPQINSVELVGNKSLNDLGIQPLITNDNKLSSTLVSGLGTAALTDASDYATAAEGALAATAVQPADLNAYQTKIDNSNKLSADLVDDTTTTNKFATAAELQQIETNKTNISLLNRTKVNGYTSGSKTVFAVTASAFSRGLFLIAFSYQTSEKVPSLILCNMASTGFGTQAVHLTPTTGAICTGVTRSADAQTLYFTLATAPYTSPQIMSLISDTQINFTGTWLDSIPV